MDDAQRPRWMPYSLIAFSSVAMVLPVVLLHRYRAKSSTNQPAPPRRGAVSIPHLRIRKPPSSSPLAVDRTVSADPFNAPLYGFKAFAIATTAVMSSAAASVAGVMAYLDVRDTTEFAARMRMLVSQSMPLLTAKIYRRPTSIDSVPGDPVLIAALAPQNLLSSPTTFDHDAAQQRLSEAFDKGGFDAWAEAVAKETEAEIEMERFRKIRTR
ncbi:hypothetical protein JVU11DRAFT_8204 [Chiua virens]|nr:hypothetical protein JVU11DRAFT_8204 [Chiua virens]